MTRTATCFLRGFAEAALALHAVEPVDERPVAKVAPGAAAPEAAAGRLAESLPRYFSGIPGPGEFR